MRQNKLINAIKYWLENTIIAFNFCPFAKKEFINGAIHYEIVENNALLEQLASLSLELKRLDKDRTIETTLVIFPTGLESFFDYLDFLQSANELIDELNYQGIYQLASFHPDYCFEDVKQSDLSNYTNRSPLPLIHIIREEGLEKALNTFSKPEQIPVRNIAFCQEKTIQDFDAILKHSMELMN